MGILKMVKIRNLALMLALSFFCKEVMGQTPEQVKDLMESIPHPPRVMMGLPKATEIMLSTSEAITKVCSTDFSAANFKNPAIRKDLEITCSFSKLFSDYAEQIKSIGSKASLVQFPDVCKDCILKLFDITQLLDGNWFETISAAGQESAFLQVRKIVLSRTIAKKALESFKRVGVYFSKDDHYDMELIRFPFYSAFFNASNPISASLAYFDAIECAPSDITCLNVKEIWGAYIAKILDANREKIESLSKDLKAIINKPPTSEVARWGVIRNVMTATDTLENLTYDQLIANDTNQAELQNLDRALNDLTNIPSNINNSHYINATKAVVAILEVQKLIERSLNFSVYDKVPLILKLWPEYDEAQKAVKSSVESLSNQMTLFVQDVDGGS